MKYIKKNKHFDPNIIWLPTADDIELNKKIIKWNLRIEEQAERKRRDRIRVKKISELFENGINAIK